MSLMTFHSKTNVEVAILIEIAHLLDWLITRYASMSQVVAGTCKICFSTYRIA